MWSWRSGFDSRLIQKWLSVGIKPMMTNNSMVNQDKMIGGGEINYTNIILIFSLYCQMLFSHRNGIVTTSWRCRAMVHGRCRNDVSMTISYDVVTMSLCYLNCLLSKHLLLWRKHLRTLTKILDFIPTHKRRRIIKYLLIFSSLPVADDSQETVSIFGEKSGRYMSVI